MDINQSLTPKQNIVALINSMNGSQLVEANFEFGTPEVLLEAETNTSVMVMPGTIRVFSGFTHLTYNRMSAVVAFKTLEPIEVKVAVGMSEETIKGLAMAKFPLHNDQWEAVSMVVPQTRGMAGSYQIKAIDSSLLYRGTYEFKLTL